MGMELQKYFEVIQQGLASSAHVKTVFGDPVSAEGKTIIPVAKMRYGFGGGGGSGPRRGGDDQRLGEGGGGGGGVQVQPVGVIEISAAGTRFIPIRSRAKMGALLLLGFALGRLLGRR
jgi:uncharacterized spore protein YtfJ